jgi:hypothetical protein
MPSARPPAGPPVKKSHARVSRSEIPRGLAGSEWGSGDFPALFFESVDFPLPSEAPSDVAAVPQKVGTIRVVAIPRECPVPPFVPPKSFGQRALSWDTFSLAKLSHRGSATVSRPAGDLIPTGQVLTAPPRLARGKGPVTSNAPIRRRAPRLRAVARPLLHPTSDFKERGARVSTAV